MARLPVIGLTRADPRMNVMSSSERVARRIIDACALLGGVVALLSFLSRLFSHQVSWLLTLRPHFAMALVTASLLTLLSAAVLLYNRGAERRSNRLFILVAVAILGSTALIAIARLWLPIHIEFELWLAKLLSPGGADRVGHLSVHAAITFLCSAGALGCLLGAPKKSAWRQPLAFLLAAIAFGSGWIALVGFAVGMPLVHRMGNPSMMWLTGLIFVFLSTGLMLSAYPNNWILQGLTGETSEAGDVRSIPYRRALVITLLFLNVGIGAVGFFLLRREQFELRSRVERELAVVADLKATEIANWRHGRLKEATLVYLTPYATRRALDALDRPTSKTTREMFTSWLDPFLDTGPYAEAIVLDEKLKVGLSHPAGAAGVLFEAERGPVQEALDTRRITVADLHQPGEAEAIYLSLVVPLVVRKEGDQETVPAAGIAPTGQDRSAGVIVLRIDAQKTLFPLMETWPTSRRTAEILLVRRDGEEGLYLNELRHQTNSPLRTRFPLTSSNNPAALAALGLERAVKGTDYRQIPVIAVTRQVPGSPWSIVAKMDESEIYAPVREHSRALGIILATLMIGVTLGLNLLWRQREIMFLRRQVSTEHERFVLTQRLAHLMKHANDVIIITDDQWRIVEVNDRGLEQYGYTQDELRRMSAPQLHAATAQSDFAVFEETFRTLGHVVTQTTHQRKNGSTFPVEASTRKVEIDGVTHNLAIIRDITERKRLEGELLEISEREQRRIADDLHDGLGQQLGGISCLTDALSKNLAKQNSEDAAAAAKICRLLTGAVAQTRGLARGLHPVEQESNGLMSALDDLSVRITDLFRVPCHFQCAKAVLIRDNAKATHLYRIVQEAVTNAIKHGRARHIEISLSATPEQITIAVSDDGTGFKPDSQHKGMGLRIMSHRAGMVGGTLDVRNRANGGTEVVCHVRNDEPDSTNGHTDLRQPEENTRRG